MVIVVVDVSDNPGADPGVGVVALVPVDTEKKLIIISVYIWREIVVGKEDRRTEREGKGRGKGTEKQSKTYKVFLPAMRG